MGAEDKLKGWYRHLLIDEAVIAKYFRSPSFRDGCEEHSYFNCMFQLSDLFYQEYPAAKDDTQFKYLVLLKFSENDVDYYALIDEGIAKALQHHHWKGYQDGYVRAGEFLLHACVALWADVNHYPDGKGIDATHHIKSLFDNRWDKLEFCTEAEHFKIHDVEKDVERIPDHYGRGDLIISTPDQLYEMILFEET